MSKILTFRGQQKQEALKRMVKLSLEPEIIVEFMENNTVYLSAQGVKFFLEDDEKKIVEEFEKQFGIKLDKRKMDLEEPIRGLGMARVPIHLHPEVVATISVQIKEK